MEIWARRMGGCALGRRGWRLGRHGFDGASQCALRRRGAIVRTACPVATVSVPPVPDVVAPGAAGTRERETRGTRAGAPSGERMERRGWRDHSYVPAMKVRPSLSTCMCALRRLGRWEARAGFWMYASTVTGECGWAMGRVGRCGGGPWGGAGRGGNVTQRRAAVDRDSGGRGAFDGVRSPGVRPHRGQLGSARTRCGRTIGRRA